MFALKNCKNRNYGQIFIFLTALELIYGVTAVLHCKKRLFLTSGYDCDVSVEVLDSLDML